MRRGNEEAHRPGIEGGLDGGGLIGTRSEVEESLHIELGGVGVGGSSHVPRLGDRGDASPTWVETKLTSPKKLPEILHKKGKLNLREEKAKGKETQISEKASSTKIA